MVLDSVLNQETKMPMFLFTPEASRPEIRSYLKNLYGITDIKHIFVRNFSGMRYKNEIGIIKKAPALKAVWLLLDEEVQVSENSVKEKGDD